MSGFVKITLAVLVGLMSSMFPFAYAQGEEIYMDGEATSKDYAKALMMMKTRGIRPVSAGDGQSPSAIPREEASAVSMKVLFAYGSAELTPEARNELDKLGAALASPDFSGERWGVEGHTDASGSADYNQSLSERRAMSVQNYLTTKFGINQDLLVPVGKGEEELYDPNNPRSHLNRRVRIKKLGG